MLRILVAMTLCCAVAPTAFADEPPIGTPLQLAKFNGPAAGSCLQTPANLPIEEDRVHQAQCQTVGDAQMYEFDPVSVSYRIRTANGLNCFEAPVGSMAGDPARMYPCNAESNQHWQVVFTPGNPNVALIRSVQNGLCLDLANGHAVLSTCDFGTGVGPTWLVNAQPARLPGTALALRSTYKDGCVALDGAPATTTCTNDGRTSLRFSPVDDTGSAFRFLGSVEGTCLVEVDGALAYEGCLTGPTSQWQLIEHSVSVLPGGDKATTWQVQSVSSGQCLNVRRGGATEESLSLWPCDTVPNALWAFHRY